MSNSVRDNVVDALVDHKAKDLPRRDVRTEAKEMADVVFEALGISDAEQDLTHLPTWNIATWDMAAEVAHQVIDNDAHLGAARKDLMHDNLKVAGLVRPVKKEVPA